MMQDLKLEYEPAEVLHRECTAVQEGLFGSPALIDLVREMISKLEPWSAVGIAAPQIGEPMQLFVIAGGVWGPDPRAIINPVVVRRGKKKTIEDEGCLSEPGKLRKVQRFPSVSFTARDEHGTHIGSELHAHSARVFQHEADHLLGLTITNTWLGAKHG